MDLGMGCSGRKGRGTELVEDPGRLRVGLGGWHWKRQG